MPGRAAAASMAERAALEGLMRQAATASSLELVGVGVASSRLSLISNPELTT